MLQKFLLGITRSDLNEPLKSFKNNDWVVHGPEGYQRITIRADSKEQLDRYVEDLI